MLRKVIRLVFVASAAVAMAVGLVATPMSAGASTDPRICEAFAPGFCIGSPDLNLFTQLSERDPGRDLTLVATGGTFQGFRTFLIEFSADPSKCVAATDSFAFLAIHACNGGLGVLWARQPIGNNDLWINQEATNANGGATRVYITGLGDGGRFILSSRPGPTGSIQQFTTLPS